MLFSFYLARYRAPFHRRAVDGTTMTRENSRSGSIQAAMVKIIVVDNSGVPGLYSLGVSDSYGLLR